ncbi:MAG: hypothetical protein H0Z29_06965 [Candidatus Marinimicrobia bacterium]|nr:hypothetical protein [Candidatus Neomarinimicrobiota bacterium]
MRVKLIFWFTIILFGYSCSIISTGRVSLNDHERPDWIDNIPEGYFVGVSTISGDISVARDKAVLNARKQIVESLGGIVQSEFIDYIYEGKDTQGIDEFSKSKIKILAKNIVSVVPEKIFIEKLETRRGYKKRILYRAYVLVPFSRKDYDRFTLELIASTTLAGRKLLDEARESVSSGDIISAVNILKNIEKNINPIFELTGIRPSLKLDLMYLKEDIDKLKRDVNNKLIIQPAKDFYTGVWGNGKLKVQVKISLISKGKSIPIPEAGIKFELLEGSADITESAITNRNGIAECIVSEIKKPNDIVIMASTDFNPSAGLSNKKCKIYIKLNNSVCSIIREKYISQNETPCIFRDIILSKFADKNFDIYDLSDQISVNFADYDDITLEKVRLFVNDKYQFIALGYMYITRYKKIDDGFYFVWANTGIKFYNLKTGQLLVGFTREEKVAGNSMEDAEIKAVRKVADNLFKQIERDLGFN